MTRIAVIGGGNIGEALVSGLVESGRDPQTIVVTNRSTERSKTLADTYGVGTTNDNNEAVDGADVVFLCVKPKQILGLLGELSLDDDTIVVSLAAGITLSAMEEVLQAGTSVIRVMPNTPMLVGKGVSACAPGRFCTEEQMNTAKELLDAVGMTIAVDEHDMDAVTALAGSSPAYYFLVTEALIDAGVQLGLKRDVATQLAKGAAAGAGALLESSPLEPSQLRANVSSPAGTTVAALRELEESGIRGAFFRAAEACATRSAELGA